MFNLRAASCFPIEKVASLLEDIRSEEPKFWPNGLGVNYFDPSNLWAITKQAAEGEEPIGFVGWQELPQGMEKVGCYSVGVLPEYRRCGLAKTAVAHVVKEKRASVDRVQALICKENVPSLGLAQDLDIHVKLANWRSDLGKIIAGFHGTKKEFMNVLPGGKVVAADLEKALFRDRMGRNLANAVATPVVTDALYQGMGMHGTDKQDGISLNPFSNAARGSMFILNSLVGGLSGGSMDRLSKPSGASQLSISGLPASLAAGVTGSLGKDAIIAGLTEAPKLRGALQDQAAATRDLATAGAQQLRNYKTPIAIGLGALALGGLSLAGMRQLARARQAGEKGRIRVSLPTRNPGDAETTVELPMNAPVLSNAMISNVERDIRRRLRHEGKARVRSRGEMLNNVTAVTGPIVDV